MLERAGNHPFVEGPNRTMIGLSVPVLLSLIAEPLTGLVDTAFVARLGSSALAALGVGTIVMSGSFWIFNFLGIGTQTSVSRSFGEGNEHDARSASGLAIVVAALIGLALVGTIPLLGIISRLMGAEGSVSDLAVRYMTWRLLGAPAVLVTVAAFGALRGLQLMKAPLWIALVVNALNIALDAVMIFGAGPIPGLGVAGAGIASSLSQWIGAIVAVAIVVRAIGWPERIEWREIGGLLVVGRDLFLRTASLTLFLVLATRAATRAGAEAGAAHQAIRQIWTFTALLLDAFAITGQSLIGYFVGARWIDQARRVAAYVCGWSLGTGVVLALLMILTTEWIGRAFVPPEAMALFRPAWWVSAIAQPLNALAFGTDGIHWGTSDFRYLRNAMVVSTIAGAVGIALLDESSVMALIAIWWITLGWITIRATAGMIRIWPGILDAPLASRP